MFYAEVVLAMREGSLINADKTTGLPLGELRQFVQSVLLPDKELGDLIERHDLNRLRKRLGMQYAINELRENLEIEIWRNSFVYYDPENPHREASARIGLTVGDEDPDKAALIARELASIVIEQVRLHRLDLTRNVASSLTEFRDGLSARMTELEQERTTRMVHLARARAAGKESVAQAIHLRLLEIDDEQKRSEKTVKDINTSQDVLADRIAAAGLDLIVELVSEKRPIPPEGRGFMIAVLSVVLAVFSLLGAALVLGAFDSRVHDTDDIARLGLPVLGHVPAFPGDDAGSLEARGVQRARVPLFRRWRSR
jgi:capsular polysaccharide biosynthesis protein